MPRENREPGILCTRPPLTRPEVASHPEASLSRMSSGAGIGASRFSKTHGSGHVSLAPNPSDPCTVPRCTFHRTRRRFVQNSAMPSGWPLPGPLHYSSPQMYELHSWGDAPGMTAPHDKGLKARPIIQSSMQRPSSLQSAPGGRSEGSFLGNRLLLAAWGMGTRGGSGGESRWRSAFRPRGRQSGTSSSGVSGGLSESRRITSRRSWGRWGSYVWPPETRTSPDEVIRSSGIELVLDS